MFAKRIVCEMKNCPNLAVVRNLLVSVKPSKFESNFNFLEYFHSMYKNRVNCGDS